MRRLAILLILSAQAFATSTVTGKLTDPSGATPGAGVAHFQLVGCGGNAPIAAGNTIATTKDFTLASDGSWSGALFRTDEISCNGQTSVTTWNFTYLTNGIPKSPTRNLTINATNCAVTCVADSITPNASFPVAPAPTDNSTFVRLDGGNQPYTGANFRPSVNNGLDLGTNLLGWRNGWFSTGIFPTATATADLGSNTFQWRDGWFSRSINNVQFANTSTSIGSAYAALPSTGGSVELTSDITISSATTLTLTVGKPLRLNFAGHTITCSGLANTSVCLKIIKPDSTPRYRLEVAGGGGTLTWSGAGTGITGLQFGDPNSPAGITDVYVHDFTISGFNTASSIGLRVDWAEEFDFEHLTFAGNTQGAFLSSTTTTTTIQNRFCNSTFQQNTTAAVIQDSSELTFCDNTVQSNSAQKAFIVKTSAAQDSNIRLLRNHFENNGDTTNSSRQVSIQAAAGKAISRVELDSNVFNGGANFPAGATNIEYVGASADIGGVHFFQNTYNNGSGCTGIPAGRGFTSEFDGCLVDVNLNPQTGATPWGITLSPPGAAKSFQIYGGFPAQLDGTLVFRDVTGATDIAYFNSSTWDFRSLVKSPQFEMGELGGSAAGAQAGIDICYADSTAHAFKCSYNNDAFTPLPRLGATGTAAIQTKRVSGCTTGAAAGNNCATDVTVTWTTAFADANYTVNCIGSVPTNVPSGPYIVSKAAGNVHVNYFAVTAAAATYSGIECTAVHD